MPAAYDIAIREIINETPEVKTFRLGPTPDGFTFDPGQFVTIACDIPGGKRVRRAYSIANPPTRAGYVDLTIRRIDDGRLSRHLFDNAHEGMAISMMGPYGRFVFREDMGSRLVLVGAGSGVVPLMCMVRYAYDRQLPLELTMLYSSKTWDHVIYRDELESMHEELANLKVMHTLTRVNGHEWHGYRGRISRHMLQECIPADAAADCLCYICGPPQMCDATATFLSEIGVPNERIRMEKYD